LFDRLIDERLYLAEITCLDIKDIAEYKVEEPKYQDMRIDELIRYYYKFVKEKSKLIYKKSPLLKMSNAEKKTFLKGRSITEILQELDRFKEIDYLIDVVFETGNKGHLKYGCNQYLFLVVLKTAMNVFITEYLCYISMIEKFFDSDITTA